MAYGQSSGTYAFQPMVGDLVLDAFERCGIESSALETKHMVSARRSSNLVQTRFALRGVNLWTVDAVPTTFNLLPGQQTQPLTMDVVGMLDTYLRTAPTPVISGFGAPNLPGNATFSTTAGSDTVTVSQLAHGFMATETVTLEVPVIVGGLSLSGSQTVASVINQDQFTITALANAGSTQGVTIDGTMGVDILLQPLSRDQYAAIPQKAQPGRPTSYWFQREIGPQIFLWPVPDTTGPWQLKTYLMHQIQDANLAGGQIPNLPYRANYAFTAALAADLAIKFSPERLTVLKQEAVEAWQEFSDDDIEHASTFFAPDFTGYG